MYVGVGGTAEDWGGGQRGKMVAKVNLIHVGGHQLKSWEAGQRGKMVGKVNLMHLMRVGDLVTS